MTRKRQVKPRPMTRLMPVFRGWNKDREPAFDYVKLDNHQLKFRTERDVWLLLSVVAEFHWGDTEHNMHACINTVREMDSRLAKHMKGKR